MDDHIPDEPITENEVRDISSMQKYETKIESSGEVYIEDEFEDSSKQQESKGIESKEIIVATEKVTNIHSREAILDTDHVNQASSR